MKPLHPIWDSEWPEELRPWKEKLWNVEARWMWNGHQWQPVIPRNPFRKPLAIPSSVRYAFAQWPVLREPPAEPGPWPWNRTTLPITVATPGTWTTLIEEATRAEAVGFDTETTGLDWNTDRVMVVQLAWYTPTRELRVVVAPVGQWTIDWHTAMRPLWNGPVLIGHNLKFDGHMSRWERPNAVWDTQIAAMLLHSSRNKLFKLDELAEEFLGVPMDKTEQTSDWSRPLTPEQIQYAGYDAAATLGIFERQRPQIYANSLERVADLEMKLLPVLIDMESTGIYLNRTYCQDQMMPLHQKIPVALQAWAEAVEAPLDLFGNPQWNANSDRQVLEAFHQMGLPITSTNAHVMARAEILCMAKRAEIDPETFPAWMVNWTTRLAERGAPTGKLGALWKEYPDSGVQWPTPPPEPPTWTPNPAKPDQKDPYEAEREEYRLYQQLPAEARTLERAVEAMEWLLLYRGFTKAEEKWVELLGFSERGSTLHPNYLQLVPSGTGRMSTSKPQLQNIPRDLAFRRAFEPRPGYKFLLAD